jgi:hypothetical protein
MEHSELEGAVRAWLDGNSINPATGVPPDALVGVRAMRLLPFGQSVMGDDVPRSPEDQWSVTATLYFPEEDAAERRVKVARIVEHLQESLAADPVVGGGWQLEWRGTDDGPSPRADAPSGYPAAVDLLLTARRRA